MDLPSGKIIEEKLVANEQELLPRFEAMYKESFNGYVCITTYNNKQGFEEAVLLFRKGYVVAAIYEFISKKKEIYSEDALRLCLNAIKADKSIVDIIYLTIQQVDLILAFNEHIKLSKEYSFDDLKRHIPLKFDENLSEKYVGEKKEDAKERSELFRKLGLFGLE